MLKYGAAIWKELLQLARDRAGLLVLFVMPTALVFIVSMVQDNVLKATGEAAIEVLFVDADPGGSLGAAIATQLTSGGAIALVRELDGVPLDPVRAKAAVARGDYQFSIILPEGLSEQLRANAKEQARSAFAGADAAEAPAPGGAAPLLYFDPTVQGAFRAAVFNALQRVMLGLELKEKAAVFSEEFPARMRQEVSRAAGPLFALGGAPLPSFEVHFSDQPLLELREEVAAVGRSLQKPNAVQQNVPAWTLFGMFFIVVPLSGLLIRERQNGTIERLMTMPVSPLTLLLGKVTAYLGVGLVQFGFMLGVGRWLLPLLGTPVLELGPQWPALLCVAASAALASCGYGLMLGSVAGSYEQASMFGAVSVVIAAAMGGVMIPLYVMPKVMQQASVLSPLGWGLSAFQEIFVRGGGFAEVLPKILALLAFFAATMLVAGLFLHRNRKLSE